MQIAFPEFVTDALSLRGNRVDVAAAHLTEGVGLDPQTALKLALETVLEQRREIITLAEEAEDARREHERLHDRIEHWRENNPDADPEESLAAILEDSPAPL
jgi:hypothetical protein